MALLLALLATQELTDATYDKWRTFIRPTEEETRFDDLPWRIEFWAAAKEANAADKPLLIWAMNGHPLACT